jgi:hypothetical protein
MPSQVHQIGICAEKGRLLEEYQVSTAKFSDAVGQLQKNIGTSSKAEYDRLQRASDEMRVASERARLALEQHVAPSSLLDAAVNRRFLRSRRGESVASPRPGRPLSVAVEC